MYFSSAVQVHVRDVVYELLGEISSDEETDSKLEQYLLKTKSECSDPQGMARTKQMARKQQNTPGTSSGGLPLATRSSVRKSPRFDSDSSIERVADLLSSDSSMSGRSPRWKSPRKKPKTTTGGVSDGGTDDPNIATPQVEPARKDLRQLIPKKKPPMKELCHQWNTTARIGLKYTETKRGWLKKTEKKRDNQNRVLRRAHSGTIALREIRHYQRCQMFLIATLPFQRLVREVCGYLCDADGQLRWQANALFTLQTAAEAYMAGFYNDVNLCALHRKVITINRKDVWLAIQLRGCDHVGGRGEVSDVGAVNVSKYQVADRSELKRQRPEVRAMSAEGRDWSYNLREAVAKDKPDPPAKKSTPMRRRKVLKKAIFGISKATFLRLAHRGGVKRFSGNIYEESHGVLKVFVETIVRDIITFCDYRRRKTVTPVDVVFALKQHGRAVYGFTRPYTFSFKKVNNPLTTGK